jgi:hypothetical protein
MPESVSLGILGHSIPTGTHLCAFYSGPDGRDELVRPCLYDLQRFGAEVLMDALRTHPIAIVDGAIHENPYYIDPGSFLGDGGLAGDRRLAWR